jgi:hypothetical protein
MQCDIRRWIGLVEAALGSFIEGKLVAGATLADQLHSLGNPATTPKGFISFLSRTPKANGALKLSAI